MKFLTDRTQVVFNELSENSFIKQFTFVGGSAAAYYLEHRLSEDLDFFTWHDRLPEDTSVFIKNISQNHTVEIANLSSTYMDLFVDDVKITFFANDWEVLKENRNQLTRNIFAADINLLCAMKVNTLSLRAIFRDYYDLYVFNKDRFTLEEIFKNAVLFIPGITKKIFGMQLSYIDDIEDENIEHLQPKYKVSLNEIQKHFESELLKFI